MNATDILKIRYTLHLFDVETLCSHTRYVYEISPDGKVVYSVFEKGITKAVERQISHSASSDDYNELCSAINACVEAADTVNQYVDDTSSVVKLFRPFCRVDTMDGGYGNQETDLRDIITGYIHSIGAMPW